MQKKLVKILIIFTGTVILLTIISRIGASFAVPTVSVSKPKRMKIAHRVESEGEVAAGFRRPVFLDEGLFVERIMALEGEKVSEGQKILKLDKEKTQKQLKELEYEYDQLILQIKTAKSEAQAERNRHGTTVKNSRKQLNLALDSTDREVKQAKDDMKQAQKEYDKALKSSKEKKEEPALPDSKGENDAKDESEENPDTGTDAGDTDKENPVNGNGDKENPDVGEDSADSGGNGLKELEREKKEAERSYYDTLAKREEQVLSAQSALEDASVPLAVNTSAEQLDIQKSMTGDKIEQIKEYIKNGYCVHSPAGGIVDEVLLSVGELSPATASFIIADVQEDFKIVVYEDVEKGKYISRGTEVNIKGRLENSEFNEYQGKVHSVRKIEKEGEECLEITVYLPPDIFSLSSYVSLSFEDYSENYDCCIPVSAFNQDDKGDFVYVTDTKQTVLGDELSARKVYVEILDRNNEYAAVAPGPVTDDMDVIITSGREIEEGNRVRKE